MSIDSDIGETGPRLAYRFGEHRRDVINGRNDLPVSVHFIQANHISEDMKVAVLKAMYYRPSEQENNAMLVCPE